MNFPMKRVGVLALATTVFATSFGTALSGATAQDQAEPALEAVQSEQAVAPVAPEAEIRFVASEVVQELPEEGEADAASAPTADSLRQLVASVDTSGEMSRELMCLAQAIYFESRGETLDGQLAVARVVINRADSPRFPDDYCSVITQRAQFSFVRNGRIPTPNRGSSAWNRAKAVARIAHRDLWESPAGDALYFHATYVRPRWASRMTTRATIHNHIFYR